MSISTWVVESEELDHGLDHDPELSVLPTIPPHLKRRICFEGVTMTRNVFIYYEIDAFNDQK